MNRNGVRREGFTISKQLLILAGTLLIIAVISVSLTRTMQSSSPDGQGENIALLADHEGVQIARLSDDPGASDFQAIRDAFVRRNPGYDLHYLPSVEKLDAADSYRVLFVQEGEGRATIHQQGGESHDSEVIVGDILLLNQGERLTSDVELSLLEFHVPETPDQELPPFIRPDWDPNITDTPGGCATDIDAYRRILLTWSEEVGNYLFHSLNAHRVRIRDSFTHYHPVDTGFDEFYLVQLTEPGARIITSERTDRIVQPGSVDRSETASLMEEYELEVGDLVYLPRGVAHRGFGGVVAQVITVPGFIPGNEIGVDHHLRRINERLELPDDEALPYNLEASEGPVIR